MFPQKHGQGRQPSLCIGSHVTFISRVQTISSQSRLPVITLSELFSSERAQFSPIMKLFKEKGKEVGEMIIRLTKLILRVHIVLRYCTTKKQSYVFTQSNCELFSTEEINPRKLSNVIFQCFEQQKNNTPQLYFGGCRCFRDRGIKQKVRDCICFFVILGKVTIYDIRN